jgi:hypothetical protein
VSHQSLRSCDSDGHHDYGLDHAPVGVGTAYELTLFAPFDVFAVDKIPSK